MQAKPSDEQLLKEAEEALQKLKKIQSDPKWEQFSDSPCLMFKMNVENRVMSKGEQKINMPIHVLFEKIGTEDSLKVINPQLKEIQVLHTLNINGKQAKVNYMRYAGIWPVEDRDLVNIGIKQKGDEECLIATQHCDYPRPLEKKVTRAKCFIGGWVLKKIDAENTLLIYISDVDLAGSIPGMIKNQLSQKQASLPSRVQKVLK